MQKKYGVLLATGITCLSLLLSSWQAQVCQAAEEDDDRVVQEQQDKRFKLIMTDMTYSYYMDMQTARWTNCPHTSEQIIDVWIKLVPDAEKMAAIGEYSYPQKYFLEHYYIRPKQQQIQFLAELEVTGHPMNDVDTGTYDSAAWENLVPESVEDRIFQAVVKNMKKTKNGTGKKNGDDDILFHVFRIGL